MKELKISEELKKHMKRYVIVRISYQDNTERKVIFYFVYADNERTAIINTMEKGTTDKKELKYMPDNIDDLIQYYSEIGEELLISEAPISF